MLSAAAAVTAMVRRVWRSVAESAEAEGVAEHADRDDEHEHLVGDDGGVELGPVQELEGAGCEQQRGDGDRHPEQPEGTERAVAEAPELAEPIGPRLAHPRIQRVVDAAGDHVEVQHQVGSGLVQADRGGALEDRPASPSRPACRSASGCR